MVICFTCQIRHPLLCTIFYVVQSNPTQSNPIQPNPIQSNPIQFNLIQLFLYYQSINQYLTETSTTYQSILSVYPPIYPPYLSIYLPSIHKFEHSLIYTTLFRTHPYYTIPDHTISYLPYNTIHTIQYHTIQHHTIPYNPISYNFFRYHIYFLLSLIDLSTKTPLQVRERATTICHSFDYFPLHCNELIAMFT
ncbi:hypothetical protein EYC80_010042 [Monilinia laxa]|uniref:Uncharacterized protein n=1 Tax=Monilinia laxa TaxID=61186 RepID=A0A5N6JSV9_MONLA|nr:hypothetical protein EYC80_010042 [Monilinia laxa]